MSNKYIQKLSIHSIQTSKWILKSRGYFLELINWKILNKNTISEVAIFDIVLVTCSIPWFLKPKRDKKKKAKPAMHRDISKSPKKIQNAMLKEFFFCVYFFFCVTLFMNQVNLQCFAQRQTGVLSGPSSFTRFRWMRHYTWSRNLAEHKIEMLPGAGCGDTWTCPRICFWSIHINYLHNEINTVYIVLKHGKLLWQMFWEIQQKVSWLKES